MNLDDSLRDDAIVNGEFTDTAAMAQAIKMVFRRGANWDKLPPEAKETMELSATSLARILNGDPTDARHWNAIAASMRLRAKGLDNIENNISRLARIRVQQRMPQTDDEDGAA